MATRFFPNFKANLITSRFGQRVHPITKVKTMHNGIDMTATNDGKVGNTDYITAHTGGTVEKVGYDWSAGNFINIRVDSRTVMVYYHMRQKSTFKKGDIVKQGDIVGYMGKTGTVTGAHLHFGIKFDGKWIDPEPYLDKDWEQPKTSCTVVLPILKNGSYGSAVKTMQILLAEYGYKGEMQESAYGSFGVKTENALKRYQSSVGLAETGECEEKTWSKLIGG